MNKSLKSYIFRLLTAYAFLYAFASSIHTPDWRIYTCIGVGILIVYLGFGGKGPKPPNFNNKLNHLFI